MGVAFELIDTWPADLRLVTRPWMTHQSGAKTPAGTASATVDLLEVILDGREIVVAGRSRSTASSTDASPRPTACRRAAFSASRSCSARAGGRTSCSTSCPTTRHAARAGGRGDRSPDLGERGAGRGPCGGRGGSAGRGGLAGRGGGRPRRDRCGGRGACAGPGRCGARLGRDRARPRPAGHAHRAHRGLLDARRELRLARDRAGRRRRSSRRIVVSFRATPRRTRALERAVRRLATVRSVVVEPAGDSSRRGTPG